MTVDEARDAIQELKAQGLNDEGIAASLYQMYKEDKLDLDQFGSLVKIVGYDLSDEFMAMSDEEKKNQEVGEFGMSDDEGEGSSSDNEGSQDNEPKEDESNKQDDADEDENPFEKYDTKKNSSNSEEDEEFKKTYGF